MPQHETKRLENCLVCNIQFFPELGPDWGVKQDSEWCPEWNSDWGPDWGPGFQMRECP